MRLSGPQDLVETLDDPRHFLMGDALTPRDLLLRDLHILEKAVSSSRPS